MNVFNRVLVALLSVAGLAAGIALALFPLSFLLWLEQWAGWTYDVLLAVWTANPQLFYVGQAAAIVAVVLVFGTLLLLEIWPRGQRTVLVLNEKGQRAELELSSVVMRLQHHLEQLADVVEAKPRVRAKGRTVHVQVEAMTSPDVDVPMKTQEILDLVREVVEQRMGLRLGRAFVHVKHAPYPAIRGEARVIGPPRS